MSTDICCMHAGAGERRRVGAGARQVNWIERDGSSKGDRFPISDEPSVPRCVGVAFIRSSTCVVARLE